MAETAEKPTVEQIRDTGQVATGADGKTQMVTVRALKNKVRDNGHTYMVGDEFHMELSLVPVHVEAGSVEIVPAVAAAQVAGREPSDPMD